ncbi:MAG: 6-bladed beta-propeller [bacterium]|nr:6-bladed beta-propeller [bacterium]
MSRSFVLCLVLLLFQPFNLNAQKIETVDGVKVVHNTSKPAWNSNPEIKLEFTGYLGELEGFDENKMFYLPADIAADPEGNLYVLDGGNYRIQKFDKNGIFLSTIGRQGQGPGEFVDPQFIDIDSKGFIYVSDPSNARIEVFDPLGKYTRTITKRNTNIAFRLNNKGEIVLRNPNLDGGRGLKKGNVPLFRILDATGKKISQFGQGIFFTKFPYSTGGNRLIFTVDIEGNTYPDFLFQNRIEKYSPEGRLIMRIDRPLPEKRKLDDTLDLYKTISAGIDVDSKGRIWDIKIKRDEKKEEQLNRVMYRTETSVSVEFKSPVTVFETDRFQLDLFSRDGIYLYSYPIDHFCDGIIIIGDTIYILDTNRNMRFFIYKIIEN